MFGRKKREAARGTVDGGEGRGVPLGGQDERPPTGYRSDEEDNTEFDIQDRADDDRDFGWEEGDPADRRRDPLRKP